MPILTDMDPNRTVLPRDPPSIVRNTQKSTERAPRSTIGDNENHVNAVFIPKVSPPKSLPRVETVPPSTIDLSQSIPSSMSLSDSLHSYFRTDRQGQTASICLLCNSFGIVDRIHHMKNSVRHCAFLSILQHTTLFQGPSYFSLPSIQIMDRCSSSERSESSITICPYRWVTFHILRNEFGGTTLFAHLKGSFGRRFRSHDMVTPASSQHVVDSGSPASYQNIDVVNHFLPTTDSSNATLPRANHELNDSWFCSLCHVYGLTSNQFWMHCLTDDHTMKLTTLKKRKSSPAVPSNPNSHPLRPVSGKFGRISHDHTSVVPKDVISPIKAISPNDENQTPNRTKPSDYTNVSEEVDSSFCTVPSTIILDETSAPCVAQDASVFHPEDAMRDGFSDCTDENGSADVNPKDILLSPNRRDELPESHIALVDQGCSTEVTDRISMLSAVSAFFDMDCANASEDETSVVTIGTTSVTDDSTMKGQSIFVGCLASDLMEEGNMEEGDNLEREDDQRETEALLSNVEMQLPTVVVEIVDESVDQIDHLAKDPICLSCSVETADHTDVHSSIEIDSVSHSLETPKFSNVDHDATREPMSFFVAQNKDKIHWSCKLCGIFNLQEHSVNCHCSGRKHRLALEKALRNSFSPPKPDFVSRSPRKVLEERLSFQMALDDAARTDPRFVHIVFTDTSTTKSSWSCQLCNMHGLQMKDVEPHCLGKKHTMSFQKFSSLQDCATIPIRRGQSTCLLPLFFGIAMFPVFLLFTLIQQAMCLGL
jgi:hypothetical protein